MTYDTISDMDRENNKYGKGKKCSLTKREDQSRRRRVTKDRLYRKYRNSKPEPLSVEEKKKFDVLTKGAHGKPS